MWPASKNGTDALLHTLIPYDSEADLYKLLMIAQHRCHSKRRTMYYPATYDQVDVDREFYLESQVIADMNIILVHKVEPLAVC